MKIVHVTTSYTGGAGIAAERLHQELRKNGFDSNILVWKEHSAPEKYVWGRDSFKHKPSFLQRWLSIFAKVIHKIHSCILHKNTEIFTSPITNCSLERHPLILQADVIHLHWISNFANTHSFFNFINRTNKKIIWTLHDMNPFMGGFHYEGDKYLNRKILIIEKIYLFIKKKSYEKLNKHQLHVISPSYWMECKAKNSNIFSRFSISTIPNIYTPPIITLPSAITLNHTSFTLMTSAQSLDVHRKGMDLFLEALKIINAELRYPITVFFAGEIKYEIDSSSFKNIKFEYLGHISLEKMIPYLSIADYFVLPSREDNLPNVMLESARVGTPIISFKNGGMSEFITENKAGILVEFQTPESLGEAILGAIRSTNPPQKKIELSKSYDSDSIIAEITRIYQS